MKLTNEIKGIEIKVNGNILATWDGRVTKCRGCGSDIGFGVSKAGARMPFDVADPIKRSHFATCSKADDFRKKKPMVNEYKEG